MQQTISEIITKNSLFFETEDNTRKLSIYTEKDSVLPLAAPAAKIKIADILL